MKKTLSIFLAVLMVITALPLTAITSFAATSGDFEYEIISEEDKTCEIIDYTGTATNLAIPSTLDGYNVISIDEEAFADCTSLESVVIGNGVTSIGNYVFDNCTSLASITIPDSVTEIGGWAFANTAYYNDITNWENDVLYIGEYLIGAKGTISGDYVVKDGTKTIAGRAFYECTSLAGVTIPDGVTSIGESAFWCCTSLASVTIGNSVTSIGNLAFYDCASLKSIIIPDSVTSMGVSAFGNCTSLASVTIGKGVTSILYCAFEDCTSLESVTIGNGVTYIDTCAFEGCTSLTDAYYTGTEEQWNAIEIGVSNEDLTSATIHYNYVISNLNGLDNESSEQTGHDKDEKATNKDEKATNKLVKDNQVWFYLGLIVAILIIVAIITWLVLSRRKRKNGNKQVD